MNRNSGFTLIELVIVIIVLGILAATAVPKFINLQDDAKAAAIKGAEAAINSAANIVYSKAAIDGIETLASQKLTVAGDTVYINYGYPTASPLGIERAVQLSGFEVKPGAGSDGGSVFYADNEASIGDLCLLYHGVASEGERYTLVAGKFVADGSCKAISTP